MKHPIDKAAANLAFSQQLADRFNTPPNTQQPIQGQPVQQASQETSQQPVSIQEPQQDQGIVQTIKDTLTPFMEKITGMFTKQEDEVKQVELKINGEMTPTQ